MKLAHSNGKQCNSLKTLKNGQLILILTSSTTYIIIILGLSDCHDSTQYRNSLSLFTIVYLISNFISLHRICVSLNNHKFPKMT